MKLYYGPGTCALAPHIVLREAGVPYTLVRVDLKTKRTEDGRDYLAINPKGYVPLLELDDGQLLTEGPAIMQYIGDLRPDSGLVPRAGTFERYRLQEWLGFINSEIHKSFSPLFRSDIVEQWRKAVTENLGRRFDYTSKHLADRPFLLGERFTAADAYLFTVFRWSEPLGIDPKQWPALVAHSERVMARRAVQEALREQGLLKDQAA